MNISCASKKDILYLQDAQTNDMNSLYNELPIIQPNDILKIDVESPQPLADLPYNRGGRQNGLQQDIQVMQLNGYLVDFENTINFPVLGKISTENKSVSDLAQIIKNELVTKGHLVKPSVNVRLLNSKITILGEVNKPGTYNFTEQSINIMQAIGYAGDLTINGKRNDILITREFNGIRQVGHLDLTSSLFMNSPFYTLRPNDLIVVNPNKPRVMNAGYIGNVGTVLTIASLVLSISILLTR